MLLLLELPHFVIFILTFLLAFFGLRHRNGTEKRKGRRYPPSFPSLPLVGSLPFLTDFAYLPELFMKKSEELGPIFTVKVGSKLVLVLNNRELVDETLAKQSVSYAGREIVFTERTLFNKNLKGIIGRQFSEEYRKYHSIYMSILKKFGFGIHNTTESRIFVELEALVDELKSRKGIAFNPKALIGSTVSNVICSMIFGRRQEFANGLSDAGRLSADFIEHIDAALEVAPIIRFIPNRWKNLQQLKNINAELFDVLTQEIKRSLTEGAPDSFTKRLVEKEGPEYDKENLLVTVKEIFVAGSDTLLSTLLWSFVLLANHPAVQDRMQREIDEAVPRDRFPSYEDGAKLPYVNATILEIMRIRTDIPLSVSRLTLKDTNVGEYFVPAGTVVIPNLHAIHMDPNVFAEPEKFRPERFLDEVNNVNKDLVIPFSIGRRSCLGEVLARQELFLTLSCLSQRFTIRPPDGVQTIEVGYCGSVVRKPEPFEVRFIPQEE